MFSHKAGFNNMSDAQNAHWRTIPKFNSPTTDENLGARGTCKGTLAQFTNHIS
jgi:hypothetical protein